MIDFKKINEVMCWQAYEGETDEAVFLRCSNRSDDLPAQEIIDIVYFGGLRRWAESLEVPTQEILYKRILSAMRRTISDTVFQDNRRLKSFPPFSNFFYFCQKIDRAGNIDSESKALSEIAWNGVICRRNIDVKTSKMFENPDKQKFDLAIQRIKTVYKYSDKDIDALRYFVCQTRHSEHNPSMNKCIYHWGDDKQTGKTTVAKVIVSILNGDVLENSGTYLSTLSRELQYNKHDIPKAALFNAVILDEAMPKDSRKSYGAVKSMLTNNSCDFDPKFKQVITVPCKRFYYFTSNDDIADFIQDAKERRMLPIHSTERPDQMSFEEIYKLWLEFCTNCEPESNWQTWYDSFDMVDGIATKDLNEIKNEILISGNTLFSTDAGTYVTAKQIANKLFKNEPTREQKKSVLEAMKQMFQLARLESNPANFTVSICRTKIYELNNEEETPIIDTSAMPF